MKIGQETWKLANIYVSAVWAAARADKSFVGMVAAQTHMSGPSGAASGGPAGCCIMETRLSGPSRAASGRLAGDAEA